MLKEKQLVFYKPNRAFEIVENFLNCPTTTGQYFGSLFQTVFTGTGSGIQLLSGEAVSPGGIRLLTGTVAGTSRTAIASLPTTLVLGSAEIELEYIFKPSALGVSAEDYEHWIGFGDNNAAGPSNVGAYIYFDWSTSNQLQYISKASSGSAVTQLSGYVATTSYARVNIKFSKSPVKATFTINGAYSWTSTNTFIDGTATGIQFVIKKYAGSSSQGLDLDLVRLKWNL